jgi:hypothetical protein
VSTDLRNTGEQLESLRDLTRLALRQAKIMHTDGLQVTLDKRERELALLWGLDPDAGLPAPTPENQAIRPNIAPEFEGLAEEIRSLDKQLMSVLDFNMTKIQDQMQQLNDGQKYIRKVQTLYQSLSESRYLDHVG